MKKNTKSFLQLTKVILALFIFSAPLQEVSAEIELTGTYLGFQYSSTNYDLKTNTGNDLTETWGHLKLKYGKTLNDIFSVEGQLGAISNTATDHGVITYGAYLKIDKDLGRYVPYGLLGVSGMYIYEDGMDSQSEAGLSYGVGIEIMGGKDMAITFEYISLIDKSVDGGDLTFDALGVGFTYYFSDDQSFFNKNRSRIRSIRY